MNRRIANTRAIAAKDLSPADRGVGSEVSYREVATMSTQKSAVFRVNENRSGSAFKSLPKEC